MKHLWIAQLARNAKAVGGYLHERDLHPEWKDVHFICHSGAHLTKRELRAFGEDIFEVIKRYYQPEDKLPPDVLPIKLTLCAFPWLSERRG
jgi:hypothetical protein